MPTGIRFIALDPGGTTGWAEFLDDIPVVVGEVGLHQVEDWLIAATGNPAISTFIIENYRIRPEPMTQGKANVWKECHEARIIGMLKILCKLRRKEFILQEPAIKPVGYAYAGLKYVKGKKGTHINDATAHGMYWYVNNYIQRRGGVA